MNIKYKILDWLSEYWWKTLIWIIIIVALSIGIKEYVIICNTACEDGTAVTNYIHQTYPKHTEILVKPDSLKVYVVKINSGPYHRWNSWSLACRVANTSEIIVVDCDDIFGEPIRNRDGKIIEDNYYDYR